MDDKTNFNSSLLAKGVNFVGQLFQNNQQIKKRDEPKMKFDFFENEKFLTVQMTHGLASSWKERLRNYTESINSQIFSLNKLNSTTLYEIFIDANKIKPTSQSYSENLFPNFKPGWKRIYLLLRRVTLDKNLRMFQY